MKHVDCLCSSGVISVLKAKLLNNSTRLDLDGIDFEKPRNCAGLRDSQQTLPQLDLAEVSLVHFGGSRNDPQWQLLRLTHISEPFSEALGGVRVCRFILSSHSMAKYSIICRVARYLFRKLPQRKHTLHPIVGLNADQYAAEMQGQLAGE